MGFSTATLAFYLAETTSSNLLFILAASISALSCFSLSWIILSAILGGFRTHEEGLAKVGRPYDWVRKAGTTLTLACAACWCCMIFMLVVGAGESVAEENRRVQAMCGFACIGVVVVAGGVMAYVLCRLAWEGRKVSKKVEADRENEKAIGL